MVYLLCRLYFWNPGLVYVQIRTGFFMKRKALESQSWVESVPQVLEREAGLLGRRSLGIWCRPVWLSRTVRTGCWLFNNSGPGTECPVKGKKQCAHLPAIYVSDHYEVVTFPMGTLKINISTTFTQPQSLAWKAEGPVVKQSKEDVRVGCQGRFSDAQSEGQSGKAASASAQTITLVK